MRPRTQAIVSLLAGVMVTAAAFYAVILPGHMAFSTSTTVTTTTATSVQLFTSTTTSVQLVTSTTTGLSGVSSTPSIHRTPVGSKPVAAAYDPLSMTTLVVNQGSDSVTSINATGFVTGTISVGHQPSAIAFDASDGLVAVTNYADNSVSLINGTADKVQSIVALTGTGPSAAAFDPKNNGLYVIDSSSGAVEVILPSSPLAGPSASILVTVPSQPQELAYNQADGNIYVTSFTPVFGGPGPGIGNGVVSVISSDTNSIVNTINVGGEPTGIAFDAKNNQTYVANLGNVSVISSTGLSAIPVGGALRSVAVNPRDGRIFVSNLAGNGSISVISPSGKVVATLNNLGAITGSGSVDPVAHTIVLPVLDQNVAISVALQSLSAWEQAGPGDAAAAYNSHNHQMYITDSLYGIVWAYQAFSHKFTRIDIGSGIEGSGYSVDGIAYSPINEEVYVAVTTLFGHDTGYVYVIDSSNNIADKINLGDHTFPGGVTYNSDDQNIYVSAVTGGGGFRNPGVVFVIDSSDNVVTQIPVGINAAGIAFDSFNNFVYVANAGEGTVSVINDNCLCVTLNVTVSASPTAIGVDPVSNLLFVGDYKAGVVTILWGALVLQTLSYGTGVNGAAYDPADGYMWIAAANKVEVFDPGSFKTLVTINNLDLINSQATCFAYSAAYNPAENGMWIINQNAGSCDGAIIYNS